MLVWLTKSALGHLYPKCRRINISTRPRGGSVRVLVIDRVLELIARWSHYRRSIRTCAARSASVLETDRSGTRIFNQRFEIDRLDLGRREAQRSEIIQIR